MVKLRECLADKSQTEIEMILTQLSGSKSPMERLNAILFGAKYKVKTAQFIDNVSRMAGDEANTFFGTPMSSFATAVLDVLGVKKYTGDDGYILEMVESGFADV